MNKEILKITKRFHNTYENLSKEYGYETREDTRVFDINSSNGKLMYATVNEVVGPILKENKQLKVNWNKLKEVIMMLKINYKGYIISQAENNHVMICKDNRMLYHAQATTKFDEEGLKNVFEHYLKLSDLLEKVKRDE